MHSLPHLPRSVFTALVLAALTVGTPAQELRTGAVVLRNATNSTVRVDADACVTLTGERRLSGFWEIAPGRLTYLMSDGEKIVGREFRGWLTTPEGSTYWTWRCTQLDSDGDFVMEVGPDLVRKHYDILSRRPVLGVVMSTEGGAKVDQVARNSAAERAGLRPGDVVTRLDDETVHTPAELTSYLWTHKAPGDTVLVHTVRDGATHVFAAKLQAAASPLPVGPSNEAIAAAAFKIATAVAAWHVAWNEYQTPSDGLLESFAKEGMIAVAREVLDAAMQSAVADLAPALGEGDRRTIANVFVALAQGDARVVHIAESRQSLGRLLVEEGMGPRDADIFAGALARIALHVQQNGY